MKQTQHTTLLLSILILTLLTGCVNLSSLQTAKPMGKGNVELSAGIGLYQGLPGTGGQSEGQPYIDPGDLETWPGVELRGRVGVTEKLDLGLSLGNVYLLDRIWMKYNLLDDGQIALAIGAEGSYSYNDNTDLGSYSGKDFSSVNLVVPLYFSFHPSESFALYAVPKGMYRHIQEVRSTGGRFPGDPTLDSTSTFNRLYAGATAGAKLGSSWGLLLEATYMANFKRSEETITQANLGVFFNL